MRGRHYTAWLGVLSLFAAPVRGDNLDPWTTIGSAGTVDEVDVGVVSFLDAQVSVASAAKLPATLDLRYNVVAVDGLLQRGPGFDAVYMTVRFRDNGAQGRVSVRLREVSLSTGLITTRITLSSDSFAPSSLFQTQDVRSTCFAGNFFNFEENAYFLEVEIRKTGSGGTPALSAIALQPKVCLI